MPPDKLLAVALLLLAGMLSSHAADLLIAGAVPARIVVAPEATVAEQTAARELCEYLQKATGAEYTTVPEPELPPEKPWVEITAAQVGGTAGEWRVKPAYVYVGATNCAKQQGVDVAALGPEEWVMRTVGEDLILAGGRPRGTLYAVYHFLEDVLGVHWWTPFEETVPKMHGVVVADLDRRGKPVLQYRDIYMLYGNDNGRFAARNRLNRQGDAPITAEYGGSRDYGPPYHVHTFYNYVPPGEHFAQHPEWFSEIGGKRVDKYAQLCLTNPELRQFVVARLRAWVEETRQKAAATGGPPPLVFSISQNDWGGACQCASCQAIAQAEESESGPLLDFLNHIADAIRDEYPDIYIDTLAYSYTQKPPKTIRPRDNIIIRLCDTGSNFIKPITDPENAEFREHLLRWAAIAKNLRIWDYAVTYAPYTGFPMPTVQTYAADFQFYAEHNVEGVFTELEYPMVADMRDYKVWMMMKLLEDPYRDYGELVRTFTDGFYGPAGPLIREYLAALEGAAEAKPSFVGMGSGPRAAHYLNLEFIRRAMALFDHAEEAVGGDPALLRRVREARLPLDRAAVALFRQLMGEWIRLGNAPEDMPLDRDAIARRYEDTWQTKADLWLGPQGATAERRAAEEEVAALTALPAYLPLPQKFRDRPAGTVFDYTADMTRNWMDIVKVVPDPEAESGITNRLEFPTTIATDDHPVEKYKLPMPWGLYDQANKRSGGGAAIMPEDVPGPGYHWYKMGEFPIGRSYYLYFFWSWIIQVDIDNVIDPANPDQKFEVWARIKFEGPAFPHGKAEDKDAICVERVVLVKTPGT